MLVPAMASACGDDSSPTPVPTNTPQATLESSPTLATQTPTKPANPGKLTIYSAREENLVGPMIKQFEDATGVDVGVKYGSNSGLAATIREEGSRSPADLFFATDPGLLGAMSDLLTPLPANILELVSPKVRSREGKWVGISGRARVVVYNTDKLSENDLPASILDFTDPMWQGRIGWPPSNGSFQAFVTGMRVILGEDQTRRWLEGIQDNDPKVYPKNTPLVKAVADGEVEVGFVNHYYLLRFLAVEGESFPARNYHPTGGDVGAMMLVNGVGVLSSSENVDNAHKLLRFMLSQVGQQYFASQTFEYPLVAGVKTDLLITPLDELKLPDIDLSQLGDIKGTQDLLRDVGVIP